MNQTQFAALPGERGFGTVAEETIPTFGAGCAVVAWIGYTVDWHLSTSALDPGYFLQPRV